MQITVSAPGKIHLLGEHTVVYGHPALLAAVDKRIYISVKREALSVKEKKDYIIHNTLDSIYFNKIIYLFKNYFKIEKLPQLDITITSQIPIGSGMGSSAALSAALLGALMKVVKNIWNPVKINELAYEAEKIAHGNPSGGG